MRRCFLLILAAAMLLSLTEGCLFRPLVSRMEDFVEDFKANCTGYNAEQWERSEIKLLNLLEEYDNKCEDMSEEDKYRFNKAVNEYRWVAKECGDRHMQEMVLDMPPVLDVSKEASLVEE